MGKKIFFKSMKEILNALADGKHVYYKNKGYEVFFHTPIGKYIVAYTATYFSCGLLALYKDKTNEFFTIEY